MQVCAGYEKTIAKDLWRSAVQVHNDCLTQLATSYKAREIEQIILDKHTTAEETA